MVKRLVLHIGMQKTGTSSIQQTLGESREILKKYNVYYPVIENFNHSFDFNPIFIDNPHKNSIHFKIKGINTKIEAELEKHRLKKMWSLEFEKNNYENFIISAEGLSILNKNGVLELRDFTKKYFDTVKIIVYVREVEGYINSFMQQRIKEGVTTLDKFNYIKDSQYYKDCIENYVQIFGKENIIVRVFDKKFFKNGNLIEDFFDSLGIDINIGKLKIRTTNESLGQNAVIFLSEYNKMYPTLINNEVNKNRGLNNPNSGYQLIKIYSSVRDEKFNVDLQLTIDEANIINEQIAYINNFLPNNQKFKHVSPTINFKKNPSLKDIDPIFFVELINQYNKSMNFLLDKIDYLKQVVEKKNIIKKSIKNLEDNEMSNNSYQKKSIENINIDYLSGWHELEKNAIIWSGPSKESSILITNINKKSDLIFGFSINHYITEDVIQSLKVYINNNNVQYLKSDSNKYILIINSKYNKDNQLEINFTVNNTYSPKELGKSIDIRKLGFVLSDLYIKEI